MDTHPWTTFQESAGVCTIHLRGSYMAGDSQDPSLGDGEVDRHATVINKEFATRWEGKEFIEE